jgi:hypothetical protein
MLKSTVALMLAAGLSFGFVVQSYAATSCPPGRKIPRVSVVKHVKTCVFSCPAGCNICPTEDSDPKTGCPVSYRCVMGKIGSGDCP